MLEVRTQQYFQPTTAAWPGNLKNEIHSNTIFLIHLVGFAVGLNEGFALGFLVGVLVEGRVVGILVVIFVGALDEG